MIYKNFNDISTVKEDIFPAFRRLVTQVFQPSKTNVNHAHQYKRVSP